MGGHDEQDDRANVAQKILLARRAIQAGIIKTLPEHGRLVEELMAAPIGPLGLVDVSRMSQEAIVFARAIGAAAGLLHQEQSAPHQKKISIEDMQCELFRHFSHLFFALTGANPETVSTSEQTKKLMMELIGGKNHQQFVRQVNEVIDELRDFYEKYRIALYREAKKLGGVKFVTGGQRAFGPSALQGIRISGLYADTQLIPDPVCPYLTANLHLNAAHLQLAIDLSYLLRLKPLVDARLPVPPIFVFPSFEQELQAQDPATMTGLNDLVVAVVGTALDESFTRVEELVDFSRGHEEQFIRAITQQRLFIPPGSSIDEHLAPEEAARRYLIALEGVRSGGVVEKMKRLPLGVLLLNGIMERLGPQFHLIENSEELDAQPLLTQAVHWHYFERCADASAKSLVRKHILTEQSFASLRALQDTSLTWIANIPIQGLAELHRNLEHQAFRDELKKYTSQLAAAGPVDIDAAVREVNTGLSYLLSKQEKELRAIEDRYSPKKWGAYAGGALSAVTAASVSLMPALAPLLGAAVPTVLAAAAGGAALGFAKEKIGEIVEKRRTSKTLIGVLAAAKNVGRS